MPGGKEREQPPRKRTEQKRTTQTEQKGSRSVARTETPTPEQQAVYNDFWSELITRSRMVPESEDPAYWPAHMLVEFRDFIQNRDHIPNQRKRAYMEQLAPIEEMIRRVEIAYKIIAYPHIQRRGLQEYIGVFLETDRQTYGRDQIELTDRELTIVQQLCETPRYAITRDPATRYKAVVPVLQPKIPFDPNQRIYQYGGIPVPDFTNPLGRRHLTTEQIRRIITQNRHRSKK